MRKLEAELAGLPPLPHLVITNGAVKSNHCRTLAFIAARRGVSAHLVLHGDARTPGDESALRMLELLGATWEVVPPELIGPTIDQRREAAIASGQLVHVIAGGCHTPAGAAAYRDAAVPVLAELAPDWVVTASGTGATQGGIAAAATLCGGTARVTGISVGRRADRGAAAVAEAAEWAGTTAAVDFRDEYLDGGYGKHTRRTDDAVALGWRHALPLDHTYTGKAMAGLLDMVQRGEVPRGSRVLLWHTGGLANHLLDDRGGNMRSVTTAPEREKA